MVDIEPNGVAEIVFFLGDASDDAEAQYTGEWVGIVRHVADVVAAFGERLRAGEIIITGSVVPPLTIEPDEDAITFEVDPIGRVAVRFE